jgi:cell division protease FtsH
MAQNMVRKWGLSERMGPLQYDDDQDDVFLARGGMTNGSKPLSSETTRMIDEEIRLIIDTCYARAQKILEDNRDKLEAMKDALLEYETIDAGQIEDIMCGRTPRQPADWNDDIQRPGRPAGSDKPAAAGGVNSTLGKPASEH